MYQAWPNMIFKLQHHVPTEIYIRENLVMTQADLSFESPRPRRPLSIGAGAIVVHENRVLLVRNIRGVTRGRYLLPAGRVNVGELPDVAAARETLEETGLQVEITGLAGVRLWVMDDGEHNYFFMFLAKLLSPVSDLKPNLDEIDDARFFTKEEMQALSIEETWSGAIAIALKALEPNASIWPNYADLSDTSGVDAPNRWRIWM
jgi:ADP-ribose pyrophosphatase YjhB (NUDIX family)